MDLFITLRSPGVYGIISSRLSDFSWFSHTHVNLANWQLESWLSLSAVCPILRTCNVLPQQQEHHL